MHRIVVLARTAVAALALAACSAYHPAAVTQAASGDRDAVAAPQSNTTDSAPATGATFGSGSGSVAGQSAPLAPGVGLEK